LIKPKYIGAILSLITDKRTQTKYNIIGEGWCSDQSNTQTFGFDEFEIPVLTRVSDRYGDVQIFENLQAQTTLTVK